jgi:hypothetical protein
MQPDQDDGWFQMPTLGGSGWGHLYDPIRGKHAAILNGCMVAGFVVTALLQRLLRPLIALPGC